MRRLQREHAFVRVGGKIEIAALMRRDRRREPGVEIVRARPAGCALRDDRRFAKQPVDNRRRRAGDDFVDQRRLVRARAGGHSHGARLWDRSVVGQPQLDDAPCAAH